MSQATLIGGDARTVLAELDTGQFQTCITSPPYWGLRDYGHDQQIGLEETPDEYVAAMVAVFREVRRVLADDGTLWVNIGDSYNDKNLSGLPWRLAFALQADGWCLRQDIIWHKPNAMPEPAIDRCAKGHEYLFLLSKSPKYFFEPMLEPADYDGRKDTMLKGSAKYQEGDILADGRNGHDVAARPHERWRWQNGVPMRNRKSVWTIPTKPFKGAHFAVMPEALVEPCILAATRKDDTVLDPFSGAATVGAVALRHGRNYVGVELNSDYVEVAQRRLETVDPLFTNLDVR